MKEPRNPFRFGPLALDEAFANREAELKELKNDAINGQDAWIVAPRRYGKSSLVGVRAHARRPRQLDDGADQDQARRKARSLHL